MKRFYIPLLLVFSFIFISCEQFIEIELPDSEPIFVINGTLEPGLPIHIVVSKTAHVLESINYGSIVDGEWIVTQFEIVKDAKVELIVDGQKSYQLTFGENDVYDNGLVVGSYTTEDLQIEVGKTYELIVSGANLVTASSTVTIPKPVEITSLVARDGVYLDNLVGIDLFMVDCTLSFNDPVEKNHYAIQVNTEGFYTYTDENGNSEDWVSIENGYPVLKSPLFGKSGGWETGPLAFLNDLSFNGGKATIDFSHFPPYGTNEFNVIVYLRNITEDWYRYETTSQVQRSNRNDPLAQPIKIHSNIKNGLGILKAGVVTEIKVPIMR